MREKIVEVLKNVNDEIIEYDGKGGLLDEQVIDSFDIINIVACLEEEFDFEIDAKYISGKYFNSIDSIVEMVKEIVKIE